MEFPFSVIDYSIENLASVLCEGPNVDPCAVASKLHLIYFEEYFSALKARTVVIENDYVDRGYLEDYAGYYVRCFVKYKRKCRRLHFFGIQFSQSDLTSLLSGNQKSIKAETLKSSYLGFVVVKPLPQTIIGRTCLKTYDDDGARRHYSSTQDFSANFFGIHLSVRTLPFQEQDSVVAACATSALWSAFHAVESHVEHVIPSPVEITRRATSLLPLETRSLPNKGLTPAQMAYAIRSVGLEPFLVDATSLGILKETAYAYLRGGMALVLGLNLLDISSSITGQPSQGKFKGLHAVALTGFSLGKSKPLDEQNDSCQGSTCLLRADRIDKIYVHDDQVGPFARMVFDEMRVQVDGNGQKVEYETLSTSWKGDNDQLGSVRAVPNILLVPLYHKIRIPFGVIHDHILFLDHFIEILRSQEMLTLDSRIEWDIYLTSVNQFKSEIFESDIEEQQKYRLLTASLPRFIWRATAFSHENPLFDLLFDTTDLEQSSLLAMVAAYDDPFFNSLIDSYKAMSEGARNHPGFSILNWMTTKSRR